MRVDTNPYQPHSVLGDLALPQRRTLSKLFALAVGLPLAADFAVLLATGTVGCCFWLFQQAAPLLILAWPISVPLAFWLHHAHKATSDAGQFKSRQLLWLAPLIVIPITMLVWGAVFAHPLGRGFVRWQLTVVHWTFFASIAIGVLAVAFNRGRRLFVALSTLMLLMFSFSCSFTAGSSVTGDWL